MASTYTVVDGTDFKARVQPRNDQVLVKRFKDQKTKAGLILPTNHNGNDVPTERGIVMAVNNESWVHPQTGIKMQTTLNVGDECMFQAYPSGCEIKQEGEEYIIIAERQVVCVLKAK